MKKMTGILTAIAVVITAEIAAAVWFICFKPDFRQSTVAVNELVMSTASVWEQKDFTALPSALDFVLIDDAGKVLFRTKSGLSESINEAISHYDTVLDILVEEKVVGKIIVYNGSINVWNSNRAAVAGIFIGAIALQIGLSALYLAYLYRTVLKPFAKLKDFAIRVAGGNLDIPLKMDRQNIFGEFTESFDLMRSELKKSKEAEAAANESKKELVAKLSHDIKTPVSSIKAAAEVGKVSARDDKTAKSFAMIEGKAEQIGSLVSNLFSAAIEELHQLHVEAADHASDEISDMLKMADYLGKTRISLIPDCLLSFDKLRLQQVLDNIISNSYKYANTAVKVNCELQDTSLKIRVEDYGGGVGEDEISLLTRKYIRGVNAAGKEGAGLGLYISRYFMREMGGDLSVENTDKGFAVTVMLKLSGR